MRPNRSGTGDGRLDRRGFARALLALPALAAPDRAAVAATAQAGERPWHHTETGFRNPPGSPERGGDRADWWRFMWRRLVAREAEPALPSGHVLGERETLAGLAALGSDGVTWLGHASFLLTLSGRRLLTDPFLSPYASPVSPFGPKRFAPPGLRPEHVPPVDAVLLSHNHYDHLDRVSLERLPGRERTTLIVPLGVERYVGDLGFKTIRRLDWHESTTLAGIRITALPAVHFSKRTFFDRNQTLWCGYAIRSAARRIYFAGDTTFGRVFEDMGGDLGPFDLGLVPIGAYEPRELMRGSHCTPEEAVAIGRSLGCRRLAAMHWGAIRLTDEPPFEPPGRFRTAGPAAGYHIDDLWTLAVGETRAL